MRSRAELEEALLIRGNDRRPDSRCCIPDASSGLPVFGQVLWPVADQLEQRLPRRSQCLRPLVHRFDHSGHRSVGDQGIEREPEFLARLSHGVLTSRGFDQPLLVTGDRLHGDPRAKPGLAGRRSGSAAHAAPAPNVPRSPRDRSGTRRGCLGPAQPPRGVHRPPAVASSRLAIGGPDSVPQRLLPRSHRATHRSSRSWPE